MILGLMTSCNKSEDPLTNNTSNIVGYSLIGQGNLHGNGGENIAQQNLVISDSNSWHELIAKMDTVNNVSDDFPEKNINFSNYRIIAVFDTIYANGGHSIDITKITEDETHTYVKVENILTGDATSVMTQPFYIAKISKNNKLIVFE